MIDSGSEKSDGGGGDFESPSNVSDRETTLPVRFLIFPNPLPRTDDSW